MEPIKIHGVPGTRQTMGPESWTSLESPLLALPQETSNWGQRSFSSNYPWVIITRSWTECGSPSKMACPNPSQVFNWLCLPTIPPCLLLLHLPLMKSQEFLGGCHLAPCLLCTGKVELEAQANEHTLAQVWAQTSPALGSLSWLTANLSTLALSTKERGLLWSHYLIT